MIMKETLVYDLIVIGGGPGGYEAAARAGELGKKTLLIEADSLGGTCLHAGCIPTKAWLKAARVYRAAQTAPWLMNAENVRLDFAALNRWRRQIIEKLTAGIAAMLKKNKVEILNATAKLAPPGRGEADGKIYETGNICWRPAALRRACQSPAGTWRSTATAR
jgi:dihydrolipoamide dehydrogenase